MKKLMTVVLISVLLLSVGCGGQTGAGESGSNGSSTGGGDVEKSGIAEDNSQVKSTPVTAVIESENLIQLDPAYTVADDDNVKIEITSLTREIMNEGNENFEYKDYRINYTVTNKTEEHDLNVYIPQSSASIGAYTVQFSQNVIETKAGKINDTCYFNCIDNPNGWSSEGSEHVQSVKDLLDFEAEINVGLMKEGVAQETYSVNASFDGFEVKDLLAEAEAEKAAQKEKYKDVFNALNSETWYFNGGTDTNLNRIRFSDAGAEIGQVYFDRNGKHEKERLNAQVSIDDTNIIVTLDAENSFNIPYSMEEDSVKLEGGFLTAEEIDEQIQGYWKLRQESFGTHEYHIHFDNGNVEYETAAEALNGSDGEYYYYGPYEGEYSLNFGGFDTEMSHGNNWFYNIVDGEAVVLYYDNICEKTDEEFPGEYGYYF